MPTREQPELSRPSPTEGKFCRYAVAIIDILGQRDVLAELDDVPLGATKEQMLPIVAKTALPLIELRVSLHGYFLRINERSVSTDLPEAVRPVAEFQFRGRNAIVRSASDTTAMMVSLRSETQAGAPPISGLYRIMVAAAGTHLRAMVRSRTMLRGGIDVGKVLEIPPLPDIESGVDIYGAVLGRAYHLEKEKAEYPRIVVGEGLLRELERVLSNQSSDVDWQISRSMAERCQQLLIRDEQAAENLFMVDFLHPSIVRRTATSPAELRSLREFVASEAVRFGKVPRPELESHYRRLEGRYRRLLDYCDFGIRRLEAPGT